jgi:Flp pilus assembly protein TadG
MRAYSADGGDDPVTRAGLHRLWRDESGQMLPLMALMLVALLAMSGLVLDVGRVFFAQRTLQASCDAAALAGATTLPNTNAVAVATNYSSIQGGLNARTAVMGATILGGYPKVLCLTTLQAQGEACVAPAYGNAIAVKQQMTLPLYFLKLVGLPTATLGASATAAMRGASSKPYNVAIIVDSTPSMNGTDSDSNCNDTRLNCAMAGVRVLLQSLAPCGAQMASCGTVSSGNVASPVDRVALYTFPGLTSANQTQYDYECGSGTKPQISAYTDPTRPQYQVVSFSSDYKTSDMATTLSGSSNLAKSAGAVASCTGLQAVSNNYRTYFAGVIVAAQADLALQAAAHPGTHNVLIFLSDGDSNAISSGLPNASPTSGIYPSLKNQCLQAVQAAQNAAAAGTLVYAVSYGSEGSGCASDSSDGLTPCTTMEQIASAPQNFFSDYTATGASGACISAAQPTTNLNTIFTQIAGDLTAARLIPDGTP